MFHYRLVAAHSNSPTSYGADEMFMTYPSPRPEPRVRGRTTPRRSRQRPYVLTTTGRVRGPSRIPATYARSGNVESKFFAGRRRVASTFVAVQPSCAFSGTTTFKRLPGRGRHRATVSLRVEVRFLGNHYLAPNRARRESVTLG